QRGAAGGVAGLGLGDRRAGMARGRAVAGAEAAFVGKELDHRAAGVHQGDAVGAAVLDAGDVRHRRAETVALVRHRARQRYRRVTRAVAAVVERERPAGQAGTRGRENLDAFAAVAAGAVGVDLGAEDVGAVR